MDHSALSVNAGRLNELALAVTFGAETVNVCVARVVPEPCVSVYVLVSAISLPYPLQIKVISARSQAIAVKFP